MLGIEFGGKLLWKKKGSVQDGQDQLEVGVRYLSSLESESRVAISEWTRRTSTRRAVRGASEEDRWSKGLHRLVEAGAVVFGSRIRMRLTGEIPEERIAEARIGVLRPVVPRFG